MAFDELNKVAHAAMAAANNDPPKAGSRMATHVIKRRDLISELCTYFIEHENIRGSAPPAVTVKSHNVKQHKRRTPLQRAAAIEAAGEMAKVMLGAFDHPIDGRPLGDLRWGELTRLCERAKIAAASHLRLGTEQVRDFILLDKIERHTNVTDHSTPVRDNISAKQALVFFDEAVMEAPHWVDEGIHAYIDSLENLRARKSIVAA